MNSVEYAFAFALAISVQKVKFWPTHDANHETFWQDSSKLPYFFGYKTEFFPSKTIPKM